MLTKLELDFAQLRHRWKIHDELFSNEEKVALLNRCGGQVFGILQNLLIYDTLATICRISDPAESMGNENNSIENLYRKKKVDLDTKTIADIDTLLESLREKMKDIRKLRNKVISHNDLDVAENRDEIPRIKYDSIDEVIYLIADVLNKVCGTKGEYKSVTKFSPGAARLVSVLEAGEKSLNG